MKSPLRPAGPDAGAWRLAVGVALGVLGLAVLPPWLPSDAARAVMTAFSWACHQLPDRSPHVHGVALALCHRCFGMLGGLVAGLALAPVAPSAVQAWVTTRRQARVLGVALVPLAVDWGVTALGLWANTPLSRVATGTVFGMAAGLLVGVSLLAPARRPGAGEGRLVPRAEAGVTTASEGGA